MRRRAPMILGLAAIALLGAGCDSTQRDLLGRALDHRIGDGKLSMVVNVTQQGGKLVTVTATGPYHTNGPAKLESFDLQLRFAYTILGTTHDVAGRLISTGDDVFIRYGGVSYDVGRDRVAAFNRRAARQAAKLGNPRSISDFKRLGLDLESWFPDSQIVGDETLNGDRVTHLHGRIDIAAVVKDMFAFIQKQGPPPPVLGNGRRLTPEQMQQAIPLIKKAITDATFDVYVDKVSGSFRRIAAHMGISIANATALGMDMRIDWTDVGQVQHIQSPSGGQPLDDLKRRLEKRFGLDFDQLEQTS